MRDDTPLTGGTKGQRHKGAKAQRGKGTKGQRQLRGKPFWKRVFPLNPFPKTFKSFGKMAWKKPFFKRVSSKISARMLNLMTLPPVGERVRELIRVGFYSPLL
jgi:hypothetical protein